MTMLQWLCHDRGLCGILGFPLWSGSLVVLVLIVVSVITFCSRLRCTQILAGATLLFAASVLQSLQPPARESAAPATAPLLANVSANVEFPIFSKINERALGRTDFAEVRTKLPRSLALEVANRHDAVLIGVDGARGRWWFATPDPTRNPPIHYGAHWYRDTLLRSPHRLGSQSFLETALRRLLPGGACTDDSWAVLNAGAHLGRWPAIAASHGCRAISLEVMPWILPFLHVTREVNGWQDLWMPLDGALGSRDGDLLNVSASGGQGVAGARGSSGYDLQVRSHRFDSLWRRFAPNATGVLAVIDVEGFEQEALLGMRRLIRSGTLKWARIEVWTHIHGARRREYPGLALLAQHGYRLCGANGREIKPQHLGALYDSMRRMCRRKFAAPAKPDGILHCQDDIEAFHQKIFDRCGGEHGGFL